MLGNQAHSYPGSLKELLLHSAKGVCRRSRPSQSATCVQRKESCCLVMDGFMLKEAERKKAHGSWR